MNNKEFKVGSHILVQGNKGIVEKITNCYEYETNKHPLDTIVITLERAEELKAKGYIKRATGRTATYFIVNFDNEPSLKNTGYNHGEYGCLDEFENYGQW